MFQYFFSGVILWVILWVYIVENLDCNKTLQILTPDILVIFLGSAYCLPILSLWLFDVYIVAGIQFNFHANQTIIVAVICSSRQKNGWFWFFAKNIFHPQNHKYGKWGRFLYKEKNQTHCLCFSMRLIFLVFWFSRFLYKFMILRRGGSTSIFTRKAVYL